MHGHNASVDLLVRRWRAWHDGCNEGHMELAIALILLVVGVMLERGRHVARPVRVHTTRR